VLSSSATQVSITIQPCNDFSSKNCQVKLSRKVEHLSRFSEIMSIGRLPSHLCERILTAGPVYEFWCLFYKATMAIWVPLTCKQAPEGGKQTCSTSPLHKQSRRLTWLINKSIEHKLNDQTRSNDPNDSIIKWPNWIKVSSHQETHMALTAHLTLTAHVVQITKPVYLIQLCCFKVQCVLKNCWLCGNSNNLRDKILKNWFVTCPINLPDLWRFSS